MPFDLLLEVGERERLGERDAAVALQPLDDLSRRRVEIGAAAMALELEFLAMGADGGEHRLGGILAARQGRCRQHAAHDHRRVHVPGLRLKADLDRDPVRSRQRQQFVELAERPDGIGTGRLEENLEDAGALAPDERVGAPGCRRHAVSPEGLFVEWREPSRSLARGASMKRRERAEIAGIRRGAALGPAEHFHPQNARALELNCR